jgi:non-ribosomal peptide synthase protein (TIGR01720 family)
LLNIIGSISKGELRLEWTFSEKIHHRETVERLAESYLEELRALIAFSRKGGAESLSPSDFPSAKLSQEDLSKVLARLGKA